MFVVIVTNFLYPIRLASFFKIFCVSIVNNRVGGPIFMTNNPKEQKKNKVNVCLILVNTKTKFNSSSSDWMIFGYFLFLEKNWSFIIGGACWRG